MQLLDLKLKHSNLYSLATGEPIQMENEGIFDTEPSFKGFWHHENLLDPILNDSDLETAWEDFLNEYETQYQDTPNDESIEKFLMAYPEPNWVIYKNTTREDENGPVISVIWIVVDLNVVKEDISEDK